MSIRLNRLRTILGEAGFHGVILWVPSGRDVLAIASPLRTHSLRRHGRSRSFARTSGPASHGLCSNHS
jgi:hypothetical protein